MSVKAKFVCMGFTPSEHGKYVHFAAVTNGEGNEDYAKYTPWGELNMLISDETKAADYFQKGKEYTLTFDEA